MYQLFRTIVYLSFFPALVSDVFLLFIIFFFFKVLLLGDEICGGFLAVVYLLCNTMRPSAWNMMFSIKQFFRGSFDYLRTVLCFILFAFFTVAIP